MADLTYGTFVQMLGNQEVRHQLAMSKLEAIITEQAARLARYEPTKKAPPRKRGSNGKTDHVAT